MEYALKARLDYGDYTAIPGDGKRYELFDGDIHVTPAPSPLHQRLVLRLARRLQDYFAPPAEVFVSPIDVILGPHDVAQPDIAVVAQPHQVSARGIEGAPLLIVEVLSPTTGTYDRTVKSQRYSALGVDHDWLADPEARAIECYRREGRFYRAVAAAEGEAILVHHDFSGLALQLDDLWR